MYATHCHDLFYITVKYHDYIPKGIQVTERTRKLQLKPSRGNNSESMTGRVVILVRDTSSWPVLQNCKVSSKYSERYSSYRADTKTFTDGRTDDGQMPGSSLYSPETFGRGIKIHFLNLFHSKAVLEMAGRQVTKCDQKSFWATSFGQNYVYLSPKELCLGDQL